MNSTYLVVKRVTLMINNFYNEDRMLAIPYGVLPNCVSPSLYHIFGFKDVDDKWFLDTTYRETSYNACR